MTSAGEPSAVALHCGLARATWPTSRPSGAGLGLEEERKVAGVEPIRTQGHQGGEAGTPDGLMEDLDAWLGEVGGEVHGHLLPSPSLPAQPGLQR